MQCKRADYGIGSSLCINQIKMSLRTYAHNVMEKDTAINVYYMDDASAKVTHTDSNHTHAHA